MHSSSSDQISKLHSLVQYSQQGSLSEKSELNQYLRQLITDGDVKVIDALLTRYETQRNQAAFSALVIPYENVTSQKELASATDHVVFRTFSIPVTLAFKGGIGPFSNSDRVVLPASVGESLFRTSVIAEMLADNDCRGAWLDPVLYRSWELKSGVSALSSMNHLNQVCSAILEALDESRDPVLPLFVPTEKTQGHLSPAMLAPQSRVDSWGAMVGVVAIAPAYDVDARVRLEHGLLRSFASMSPLAQSIPRAWAPDFTLAVRDGIRAAGYSVLRVGAEKGGCSPIQVLSASAL